MIAVIAASSAKRRSVQILTYCRGRCIYTASRARHICMLRDNWPVIDWREPIGLQERLEGRSSHNGVISVMSRSRFQGTEVTIVTGAFSAELSGRDRGESARFRRFPRSFQEGTVGKVHVFFVFCYSSLGYGR